MLKIFTTKLAGVSFGDCQKNIKKWGCPEYGIYDLIHEPDNPHDPNAVRVITLDSHAMGYLPKSIAAKIAPRINSGRAFIAEFVCLNEYAPHDRVGLTVRIVEITD